VQDFSYIVIFITVSTVDEAQVISEKLLGERKVACATIVPEVDSRFWWKGNIDQCKECMLVLKTKASMFDQVVDMVKSLHSYEVPEIIAMPVVDGNGDYLKWIDDEVRE
jgi:periplasmic divalent cation tolerance protein